MCKCPYMFFFLLYILRYTSTDILQTSPFEILFVNGEHILITDVEDHGFTQNDCVNLNRPFQKAEETWFDNYFCIKKLTTDEGD